MGDFAPCLPFGSTMFPPIPPTDNRGNTNMTTGALRRGIAAAGIAVLLAAGATGTGLCDDSTKIRIADNDLGGVVKSANGPEAGVWVIAETPDLPTRFAKIVVTDGQGRYLMPDLPKASYGVWVRGYGLVDSPKVQATPGKHVNLTAVVAPNPRAAAQYYPAAYWY